MARQFVQGVPAFRDPVVVSGDELLQRRNDGVAILYATANMDEAERCDRVAMLEQGRLKRQGTPLELVAAGEGSLVAVSGESVRGYREELRKLPETRFVFPVGPRLNVWLHQGVSLDAFRTTLSTQFAALQAQPLTPTLHDAAVRDLAEAGSVEHGD